MARELDQIREKAIPLMNNLNSTLHAIVAAAENMNRPMQNYSKTPESRNYEAHIYSNSMHATTWNEPSQASTSLETEQNIIQSCIKQLETECIPAIQNLLRNDLRKNVSSSRHGAQSVAGSGVSHMRDLQKATEEEFMRGQRLLQKIQISISNAREVLGKVGSSGLDSIVASVGGVSSTGGASYSLVDLTNETISYRDVKRYGLAPSGDYPMPYLGTPGYERSGDLSEKIRHGMGFSESPGMHQESIKLPNYYYKMTQDGLSNLNNSGQYLVLEDKDSRDSTLYAPQTTIRLF